MQKNTKTKVITLSSFTTVRPIITKNPTDDWVIYDFADLFKYQKSCFSSCPSILETPSSYLASATNTFFKLPNILKIAHKFWQSEYTLIHKYKLGVLEAYGESQTEKFTLEMLYSLFGFLVHDHTASIPEDIKLSLWNQRHRYLATKDLNNIDEFTQKKVAEALVQKAFCSQVLISDDDWLKIDYIIQTKEPFIIEADTNPLHAHYLMSQISERYPEIEWGKHAEVQLYHQRLMAIERSIVQMSEREVLQSFINPTSAANQQDANTKVAEIALPRQLSPTITFASSYDYHTYSSEYNNKKFNVTAPTIMQKLVEQYGAENLEFISHFNFNRDEAERLGVTSKTLDQFFPSDLKAESKKKI